MTPSRGSANVVQDQLAHSVRTSRAAGGVEVSTPRSIQRVDDRHRPAYFRGAVLVPAEREQSLRQAGLTAGARPRPAGLARTRALASDADAHLEHERTCTGVFTGQRECMVATSRGTKTRRPGQCALSSSRWIMDELILRLIAGRGPDLQGGSGAGLNLSVHLVSGCSAPPADRRPGPVPSRGGADASRTSSPWSARCAPRRGQDGRPRRRPPNMAELAQPGERGGEDCRRPCDDGFDMDPRRQ